MSVYPVENPFINIDNLLGLPITGGRVYIGTPGNDPETSPQPVYWDAAGTIPAAQPLPLKGGYIVNAGSPAKPFTADNYSIRVYDFLGNVVFYDPSAQGRLSAFASLLASTSGAGMIGMQQGLEYPANTVGDFLNKVLAKEGKVSYASDVGIINDGVTDQYAKIQAWLNSGVATYYVFTSKPNDPAYVCNSTVDLPGGITVVGQNMSGTQIVSNAVTLPIFSINGTQRMSIQSLRLGYNGTPAIGADAIYCNASYFCDFRDIWCENVYTGLTLTDAPFGGSGNHFVSGMRGFKYVRAGILLQNVLDTCIAPCRLSALDSILGTDAGISIVGGCEAITIVQPDITLGAGHSISAVGIGGSTARGQSPFDIKIIGANLDSPKGAALFLRQTSHFTVIDSWIASAGHDEAVGFGSALNFSGIDMSQCTHTQFIGGELYNNGGRGALVYSDCKFTLFSGISVKRNQYSRPPGSAAGIEFISGTTDFVVKNCLFERDPDTTNYQMNVAVLVNAGPSDRYIVSDNLLGGTFIADSGSGTNKSVGNNF